MERRHYADIIDREARCVGTPAITIKTVPEGWQVEQSGLIIGHVVISVDYFKRFLATLRGIVGGRVKSYESLLDRGRREAILRAKEDAIARGYNALINLRVDSSRIASSRQDGKGGRRRRGSRLRDRPQGPWSVIPGESGLSR